MAFAHPPSIVRTQVLCIRRHPRKSDLEFTNRQLRAVRVSASDALKQVNSARGLIISFDDKRPGTLAQELRDIGVPALDHGLQVHVIATSDGDQTHISHAIGVLKLTDQVRAHTSPKDCDLADQIARHDPGPGAGAPRLTGRPVNDRTALFLRRAFCDCSELLIVDLPGGMTADVMCVHARFAASESGPRPLPFFAKIANRTSFRKELEIYKHFIDHFIPFNLRPNVDYERCIDGASHGMIVGNFVERSEAMLDVAARGNAQQPIYSLFNDALRGWRLQAKEESANLHKQLKWFFVKEDMLPALVARAHALGATHTPDELSDILVAADPTKHLCGPIHADLHGRNVRVRGNDAILIDFERVRQGPILADRALFEVSLAFEERSGDNNDGWFGLIDTLYGQAHFVKAPPPPLDPAPREWLWNCVRQVRAFALADETTPKEYQLITAICLLRYARLPCRNTDTDVADERRAYAYVIAERLMRDFKK